MVPNEDSLYTPTYLTLYPVNTTLIEADWRKPLPQFKDFDLESPEGGMTFLVRLGSGEVSFNSNSSC